MQTKILSHDEMYNGEDSFVAVLTQERALRLLEANESLYFDSLFVDEAHHLFESDARGMRLSRLVRLTKQRNSETQIVFTSPVISDPSKLSAISKSDVHDLRIAFNVKEPRYYYLTQEGEFKAYNRFFDNQVLVKTYHSFWRCIEEEAVGKTLIYISSPRKIQEFANTFARHLPTIEMTERVIEIVSLLKKYVHSDYDQAECIKHGVVYLHGQMPDGIKSYIEAKFKAMPEIKFVVANGVVLEGVNLPLDSIFIMSSSHLQKQNLVNLIGRAGRLNRVFGTERDLGLLRPKVVFIDNNRYNRKNGNMQNLMRKVRSSSFENKVKNPLILKSEGRQLDQKDIDAIAVEEFVLEPHSDEIDALKADLFKLGFSEIYSLAPEVITRLYGRLTNKESRYSADLFDLICEVFIDGLENDIRDRSFLRFSNLETRNHYRAFLEQRNTLPLNERIGKTVAYFNRVAISPNSIMFISKYFGDADLQNGNSSGYADLAQKTKPEIVGLAVAKIKNEEDFLNFKISRFVRLLHKYNLLNDRSFNLFVYGTDDGEKIRLSRLGLPIPLIEYLEDNNLLNSLVFDDFGNINAQPELYDFARNVDDYTRCTLERYVL